jgi:hypothetical protein
MKRRISAPDRAGAGARHALGILEGWKILKGKSQ